MRCGSGAQGREGHVDRVLRRTGHGRDGGRWGATAAVLTGSESGPVQPRAGRRRRPEPSATISHAANLRRPNRQGRRRRRCTAYRWPGALHAQPSRLRCCPCGPGRPALPFTALVIGSMTPDAEYYLPFEPFPRRLTHAFVGVLTVDLVLGVAMVVAVQLVLAAPLAALLPEAWGDRVRAWGRTGVPRSVVAAALTVAALIVGAATATSSGTRSHTSTARSWSTYPRFAVRSGTIPSFNGCSCSARCSGWSRHRRLALVAPPLVGLRSALRCGS